MKSKTIIPSLLGSPSLLKINYYHVKLALGEAIGIIIMGVTDEIGMSTDGLYTPFMKIDLSQADGSGWQMLAKLNLNLPIPSGFGVIGMEFNLHDPIIANTARYRIKEYRDKDIKLSELLLDVAFVIVVTYLVGKISMRALKKVWKVAKSAKFQDNAIKKLENKIDKYHDEITTQLNELDATMHDIENNLLNSMETLENSLSESIMTLESNVVDAMKETNAELMSNIDELKAEMNQGLNTLSEQLAKLDSAQKAQMISFAQKAAKQSKNIMHSISRSVLENVEGYSDVIRNSGDAEIVRRLLMTANI